MTDFDIVFQYPTNLPDGYLDDFRKSLKIDGLNTCEIEREPEVMASVELAITGFAIYLAKELLAPTFKKAGVDLAENVYPLIISGFSDFAKKIFLRNRIPFKRVTINEVTDCPDTSYLMIYAKTMTGKKVSFIFENNITEEQYDICIAQIFQLLEKHYASKNNDDYLSSQIATLPDNRQAQIYMTYSPDLEVWKVKDPIQEILEKQNIPKSISKT